MVIFSLRCFGHVSERSENGSAFSSPLLYLDHQSLSQTCLYESDLSTVMDVFRSHLHIIQELFSVFLMVVAESPLVSDC